MRPFAVEACIATRSAGVDRGRFSQRWDAWRAENENARRGISPMPGVGSAPCPAWAIFATNALTLVHVSVHTKNATSGGITGGIASHGCNDRHRGRWIPRQGGSFA